MGRIKVSQLRGVSPDPPGLLGSVDLEADRERYLAAPTGQAPSFVVGRCAPEIGDFLVEQDVEPGARGQSSRDDVADQQMIVLRRRLGMPGDIARTGVEHSAAELADCLPDGALPGLTLLPLPLVQPSAGKGEFVDGNIQQDTNGGWRSTARVTKSDVDTFLFATFAFEKPLDLRDAVCLVVDTTVPDGQRAATPLRIIAQDKNGIEYLANTDRPLNASGAMRNFIILDEFERAGWSKPAPAEFDWSAVTAIRVGWGGYIGTEGDTLAWTLAPLQIAKSAEPKK